MRAHGLIRWQEQLKFNGTLKWFNNQLLVWKCVIEKSKVRRTINFRCFKCKTKPFWKKGPFLMSPASVWKCEGVDKSIKFNGYFTCYLGFLAMKRAGLCFNFFFPFHERCWNGNWEEKKDRKKKTMKLIIWTLIIFSCISSIIFWEIESKNSH